MSHVKSSRMRLSNLSAPPAPRPAPVIELLGNGLWSVCFYDADGSTSYVLSTGLCGFGHCLLQCMRALVRLTAYAVVIYKNRSTFFPIPLACGRVNNMTFSATKTSIASAGLWIILINILAGKFSSWSATAQRKHVFTLFS